ncbi:MAG: PaaI family thioesterase [Promethearchaeota archaeon]|nr:MAG: PaaI family thioesterase [Candidatus Lokiarchaeota archaeon]
MIDYKDGGIDITKRDRVDPAIDQQMLERSQKMVNLLQAIKGRPLKEFPAPPFTKWLNGRIISVKRGDLQLEIEVRPEMSNPTGILHGGMQSAILDDSIGMMTTTLGYEGFLISIDMHVDFLGRVKIGEVVRSHSYLVREGRHIVHAGAELANEVGELVATGNSNLLVTHKRVDYGVD